MTTYTPVVYKVSGESLSETDKGSFSPVSTRRFTFVAEEIRLLVEQGYIPCVVVGGGNIFRGGERAAEFGVDSAKLDKPGMTATKFNAEVLEIALAKKGLSVVVRTRGDVGGIPWNTPEARELLERGTVVVLAGGMGEPGMSSDVPAVFHAVEIGASAVLVAKNGIVGVHAGDPKLDPSAVLLPETTCTAILQGGLLFMDATAIEQARSSGTTIFVFSSNRRAGGLNAVMHGRAGTVVHPE